MRTMDASVEFEVSEESDSLKSFTETLRSRVRLVQIRQP